MAFFLGWHVANASESCLHVCVLELLVLFFLVVLSLLSVHTQNKGAERERERDEKDITRTLFPQLLK